jgi:putative FmdB family regulatory protein
MPIYEYRCPNGHVFEVFQRMDDPQPEKCETCGAGPLQRVLFPVAVHFKGSGFYSTDYGRGRKAAKEGAGAEAGGGDSGGGEKGEKSEKKEKAAD